MFSFGRGNYYKQVSIGNSISKKHRVIGICHEDGDMERLLAAGWKNPIVTFHNDIELYLSYFKNASYIISGRLHGILPSIAFGKKCMYFGTDDTRTTILHDIGVPIYKLNDLKNFKDLCCVFENQNLFDFFKSNMVKVAHSIFDKE
ncbi:Polysaccharide pyruvyl transferase [compost metagenome]